MVTAIFETPDRPPTKYRTALASRLYMRALPTLSPALALEALCEYGDEAIDVDISPATFDEDYYLQPSLKKARELLSS